MNEMMIKLFALAGCILAVYFDLVLISSDPIMGRIIPPILKVENPVCAAVMKSPGGKVFSIPNCVLGTAYYLMLIVLPIKIFLPYFLIAAFFSVGLGLYLMRVLIRSLRIHCLPCYAAHALNLIIANMLLLFTYYNRYSL